MASNNSRADFDRCWKLSEAVRKVEDININIDIAMFINIIHCTPEKSFPN